MYIEQLTAKMVALPLYQSHKIVGALKIKWIICSEDQFGDMFIHPFDEKYNPFRIPKSYIEKYKPQCNGYYVQYENGEEAYYSEDKFEKEFDLI